MTEQINLGLQRAGALWHLFEQPRDGMPIVMATFRDGAQAARFAQIIKLAGAPESVGCVRLTIHLPDRILEKLNLKRPKALQEE